MKMTLLQHTTIRRINTGVKMPDRNIPARLLPLPVDNPDEFLVCFLTNIFIKFSLNYYKSKD